MPPKFKTPVLIAAILIAFFGFTAAAQARDGAPALPTPAGGEPTVVDATRLAEENNNGHYMIELVGAPAAQVYADAIAAGLLNSDVTAATQDHIASLEVTQARVASEITNIGATVLYSLQRVNNSIAIIVDSPQQLEQIQRLPEVNRIYPITLHTLGNVTSVPFIGSALVWENLVYTGEDMSIGIIDTGIDYLHLGFDGTQDYANQTDPTLITDTPFPAGRVVGGTDFVGDSYNASDPANDIPMPDPAPTDCNGHGSHVAGTAAGNGVYEYIAGDYFAWTGPYNTDLYGALNALPPGAEWVIGPGVAPEADLWALKVFGCGGSTAVTSLAIEYSTDPNGDGDFSDHLDVINMSLGAAYGGQDDDSVIASDNAALIGVSVVASAGNSGDVNFITGSPGSSARTVSTASSYDSGESAIGFTFGGTTYPAIPAGFGPAITSAISDPIEVPSGAATGCSASDFSGFTAGNIALIDRGACAFTTKVLNAEAAGASAAIVTNVTTNIPISMGGNAPFPTIPSVMSSGDAGDVVKAGLPGSGTIDPGNPVPLTDSLSGFSSRGPARVDDTIMMKPDIAAPGSNITSVLTGYTVGNGWEPLTISGTSMAAPHIAGTMALLRQAYPDLTPEQLKALAMNTAQSPIELWVEFPNLLVGNARAGAHRVNHINAFQADAIAYGTEMGAAVKLSYDIDPIGASDFYGYFDTGTQAQWLTIENLSGSPITFTKSVLPIVDWAGITPDFSGTITVPANSSVNIPAPVDYDSEMLYKNCDPALVTPPTAGRHCLAEENGFLILTYGGQELWVPYYVHADVHSEMYATASTVYTNGDCSATIFSDGLELDLSSLATDLYEFQTSYVTAFELVGADNNEAFSSNMSNNADLAHLGINTPGDGTAFFGINTYGEWSTPDEVEFDIYIDLDQDGIEDLILLNCSGGDDVFNVCFVDLAGLYAAPGSLLSFGDLVNVFDSEIDTRVFRNDVMFLPFDMTLYDIPAIFGSDPAFDMWVVTFSRDFTGAVDCVPSCDGSLSFTVDNYLAPDTTVPLLSPDYADPTPIPVDTVGDAQILLLHHHNPTGARAEVVNVIDGFGGGVELLLNGSFETDDNWSTFGDAVLQGIGANAFDGTRAALVGQSDAETNDLVRQTLTGLPGGAGDILRLTYYIGGENVPGSTAMGAQVRLYSGGSPVQTANCLSSESGTFNWTQVTCEINANAAFDELELNLGWQDPTGSSLIGFDGVSVVWFDN
ncbi:MAG: S8 family serine peptidase [Anaerolineae bacterium]